MTRNVRTLCVTLWVMAGLAWAAPASAQCGPGGCRIPGALPAARPPQTAPARPVAPPQGELPEAVRHCYHSIVRVRCEPWAGSGTYLGDRLVLTCEHVLRNGSSTITVTFPSGVACSARAVASDPGADLALVELLEAAPAQAQGVPLADSTPNVGERIYTAGYGRSGTLMVSAGRISNLDQTTIAVDPTNRTERSRRTAEGTGLSESGDSGGAWLTSDGRLRGVVWGGREQDHTVSATVELCQFLQDACQRGRRPFPKPDELPVPPSPPPASVAPVAPPVDLGPIERRLDTIDGRLSSLENPPSRRRPLLWDWLAVAVGLISGGSFYYWRVSEP